MKHHTKDKGDVGIGMVISVAEIPDRLINTFTLRVAPSKNSQIRGVNVAADFENPLRLFE
jgi:hypothetical protein